jgi:hypothetical protein
MHQSDPQFLALQEALVGRYSLETELGRGGMGIVYLALDVRLDRPIALKVLPEHLAIHATLRQRFLAEARTAAKLSHPSIVPIHSVEEVGEFVFFAMAYVAGETLGARVRRRGPLAPSECTRLMREVGFALSYAHAQGVIHRDIKPDNILLEEGSGRALVADFGIAGVVGDAEGLEEGEIVGTVEFMSPEQASGDRVDFRSDLYSLGMVAYYALTGELPFTSDSLPATLEQVRHAPVPAVITVATTAPRRLGRIIDACLKKDPEERFPSAERLTEALEAAASVRKQIPVAVRSFLYDPVDLGGDAREYFTIAGFASLPLAFTAVVVPEAGAFALACYVMTALGVPAFLAPPRVRRLLKSGNTVEDLDIGLREDLEQWKEEAPRRSPSRLDRIRARVRSWSLAGVAGSWSLLWTALFLDELGIIGGMSAAQLFAAIIAAGGVSTVGLLLGARDEERRALLKAERRTKFWRSRIGRGLISLCGIGLRRRAAEVRATHRPTELQIGLAVEALFDALPKEAKKVVGDVPGTVARLEADARQLREYVEMLTEADAQGLQSNRRLPSDLRATREQAQRQHTEVIAALETIRLGLLRLSAGTGTVEGLTTNLVAASDIRHAVDHLLEGRAEVEEALRSTGGGF